MTRLGPRVLIIQPCLPHYRIPLFDGLYEEFENRLSILCSREDPGTGARSSEQLSSYVNSTVRTRTFLGKRLFWQSIGHGVRELQKGDVLVINGNPRYLSSLWWAQLARMRGIKVMWWGHGWTPGSNKWRAAIRRQIMKLADAIVLYTDEERDEYLAHGFRADKIFAANNAIDQVPIKRESDKWTAATAMRHLMALGYSGRPFFIFSSRLIPKTHLNQALEALKVVRGQGHDVGLVVVGDGLMMPEWAAQAQELGVPVEWLGAVFDQEQIAPWFRAAVAFVYPGAVGLSLLHAFGYGVPAIIHHNKLGHAPEIAAFSNKYNGLEFTEGDIMSMASAMQQMLEEPTMQSELGKNALRTVEERFSMSGMVNNMRAAIEWVSIQD